ncbi:hypothetical protein QGP82_07415 [Leptothoe sp. LEGE 181152]|nr:hypothetical protein [Leptothoe sp. LEGE 181152]
MSNFNPEEAAARIELGTIQLKYMKVDREKIFQHLEDALNRIDEYVKKKNTPGITPCKDNEDDEICQTVKELLENKQFREITKKLKSDMYKTCKDHFKSYLHTCCGDPK